MSPASITIRPTVSDDWQEIRALRLEMVRDTPIGFAETAEMVLAQDEENWRMRGERGTTEQEVSLVAITEDGRWVGTMRGSLRHPPSGPMLMGVYITPDFRGTEAGVTDALLGAIEDWARTKGDTLTLGVHEDNERARRYYERRGFVATGAYGPYNLDPSRRELEMVKQLS